MYFTQLEQRLGRAQINYHFHFSFKHRYLYVQTSKCACTYMKSGLSFAELAAGGWWSADYKHTDPKVVFRDAMAPSPHLPVNRSVFIKPYQLPETLFDDFIGNPANFKFAVVRNPFERVLSAYLDTVKRGRLPFNSLKGAVASLKNISPDAVNGQDVTFVEFLTALRDMRDQSGWSAIDQHYREQSFHIGDDIIPYTKIYRMEHLDSIAADLSSVLGIRFQSQNRGTHTTNAADRVAELYADKTCVELVEDIYAKDIERFDYEFPSD